MIEKMAEAYWNAFRDGFITVGGNAKDYPKWAGSSDPIKNETLRCLRHAVEVLKPVWGKPFEEIFPEKPQRRRTKPTVTEVAFAMKNRRAK